MTNKPFFIRTALLISLFAVFSARASDGGSYEQVVWTDNLRYSYFEDRKITESDDVIQLHAPGEAEDASVVPIKIYAMLPQSEQRYIKEVTLLIDNNPIPFAGRFRFSPHSGRADLGMRIRLNAFSYVRAVAELNDGSLYMSKQYIKAFGGCSAPVPVDLEKAMTRLGKMKLKLSANTGDNKPLSGKLLISHPNFSGFQMSDGNGERIPERYVKQMKITYAGNEVLSAETNVSISSDPTFRFYVLPEGGGELLAEVTDSTGETFTKTIDVAGN